MISQLFCEVVDGYHQLLSTPTISECLWHKGAAAAEGEGNKCSHSILHRSRVKESARALREGEWKRSRDLAVCRIGTENSICRGSAVLQGG